jgi:hypothetical protein
MNPIKLLPALAFALAPAFALMPSPVLAAHAGAPYENVDHSNDAGNDTGDSKVGGLNSGQLNQNYSGPMQLRTPATTPSAAQPPVVQAPTAQPAPAVPPQ